MRPSLKTRLQDLGSLWLVWNLLLACALLPRQVTSTPNPAREMEQPTATAIPAGSQNIPTVEAAIPTPTVLISPTAVPQSSAAPSQPVIVNTYPVQNSLSGNKGGGPFSALLALPGQVWTATMFSGLQQWDPQTGKVVKTISGVPSKGFYDLKVDGQNLWVLANDQFVDTYPDALYVIGLPGGDIVKKIDLENGAYLTQIGLSPGKVWIESTIYDTITLQPNEISSGLPFETHFAYDGEQYMWITGSHCDGCGHDLWLYDAANLPNHKDKENSGTPDDGVLGSPLVLAGGKMWLVVRPNGNPIYVLDAYDIHKTDRPLFQVDLTPEFKETDSQTSSVHITADNHVVWLSIVGRLLYFDQETGQKLGSLSIGEHVTGMGFDGKSLWVLSNDEGLIQVFLPWE